ncbi:MAG: ergothioneine biosynthesis protein EgtC [Isosphaeraceae bacterium]
MCRIAAYLGPPLRLSRLFHESPHGLADQGRHARLMSDGSVAGDGWGVGWFGPESDSPPGLLKSILPIWSDENAKTATHAVLSGSIVGHIRYASPNIETCLTNTPLYVMDDHLWTINGMLEPWPGPLSKNIRDCLDPDHEADLRGATDGEMMGAMWRTHFRRTGGQNAAAALRSMLKEVRDRTLSHNGVIKTNLILSSQRELLGVRYAEPGESNSLYYLHREERWQGGSVIASEPLDEGPGWKEVKPGTLVRIKDDHVSLEALDLDVTIAPRHRRSA